MQVSIVIKSLNEEKNIARAIESSLKVIEKLKGDGEVILADSLSTDKTIEIAQKYPIKIVQLKKKSDRSCGIGAELGRTVSEGEYIYILDADMVFDEAFLPKAIRMLEENDKLAGVAGIVVEMHLDNIEFQERMKREDSGIVTGRLSHLPGGGLYRASALESVGYFTHQGLNSYEEFELGARLTEKGWWLFRMELSSVQHYGHQMDAYKLLIKRVKSGYIYGLGELLRSAYGKSHFNFVVKNLKQIKLFLGYLIWLFVLLGSAILGGIGFISIFYFLIILVIPFLGMSIRKKSIKLGLYSVVAGVFNAYGLLVGFLKSTIKSPIRKIDFKWIKGADCI